MITNKTIYISTDGKTFQTIEEANEYESDYLCKEYYLKFSKSLIFELDYTKYYLFTDIVTWRKLIKGFTIYHFGENYILSIEDPPSFPIFCRPYIVYDEDDNAKIEIEYFDKNRLERIYKQAHSMISIIEASNFIKET